MVSNIPPPLSTINQVEPESDDKESWMWINEQKDTIFQKIAVQVLCKTGVYCIGFMEAYLQINGTKINMRLTYQLANLKVAIINLTLTKKNLLIVTFKPILNKIIVK